MSMSHATTTAGPPTAPEHLPDDLATLKRMVLELLATVQQQQRDHDALQHRLALLLARLYGPRTERFDPDQPLLFPDPEAEPASAAPPPAPPAKPKRRCRPHGRRRLSTTNLPREPKHHELPEAARLCPRCGKVRVDIGVDKSEQLEYQPASLRVIEHFVHKYTCPCCNGQRASTAGPPQGPNQESAPMPSLPSEPSSGPPAPRPPDGPAEPVAPPPVATDSLPAPEPPPAVVSAAAKPAMPIAKGMPGPGLLAHLIVSKYVDHLPLHRLEHIYERQGLFLPRSTLCDWLAACAVLLRPLYEQLVAVVLQSRALHTDDTTVKLQDPRTHQLSTARLWAYLGDAAHRYNAFDFTINRKRDGPQQFLANYQGYLHADAFSGYDGLYVPDPATAQARIVEVACNAHARRKFYEARSSDALGSHQALAYYRQLYELERGASNLHFTDGQRLQMRQDLSVPILAKFQAWLVQQRPKVLPKSPMAEALGYALNNWSALVRYTEAGYLAIDNNVAEREMKRIAIGRKNWLFVGSPQGGQTAAVLLSFTSTCQRVGLEPWAYLHDVLGRLPTTPVGQLGELLPDPWQAACQAKSASSPPTTSPSTESDS
jgi:transposase